MANGSDLRPIPIMPKCKDPTTEGDRDKMVRYKMALEAILAINGSGSIAIAQAALRGESK